MDDGIAGRDKDAEAVLRSQLGEAEYSELRALATRAVAAGGRRGPARDRVVILPGIMGSELGKDRGLLSFFTDLIWLDPLDTMIGSIERLKFNPKTLVPEDKAIRALGPFPIVYWKLRLVLEAAGYDVTTIGYDWRHRLDVLGKFLADELNKDKKHAKIHIVAHSMGGLVTRAMLKHLKDTGDKAMRARLQRIVTIATPHGGSFQAVKALRGTHDMANLVSDLDFANSRSELTRKVFSTLPGLYHLLPRESGAFDVFDPAAWPSGNGLKPHPEVLKFSRDTLEMMAPPEGFLTIIGTDNPTTIAARVEGDHFVYSNSANGDGTVPRTLAEMDTDKALRWYYQGSHMTLPMEADVQQAVIELLQNGKTSKLKSSHIDNPSVTAEKEDPPTRGARRTAGKRALPDDVKLRQMLAPLLRATTPVNLSSSGGMGSGLSVVPAPVTSAGYSHKLPDVVIGRRKQRQIDLELYRGDLTDCFARAYALGTWAGVEPGGAASSVDKLMDGAIQDMFKRRFFGGQVGEIFMMPTGRWPVKTELLLFAGMGPFDRFESATLEVVAENVIRTFVRCNVEEFALVPFTGASVSMGMVGNSIECLMRGFVRGIMDADDTGHFRRIILCERDPERFAIIKEQLVRLATSELCADVELCLRDLEVKVPAPATTGIERGFGEAKDQQSTCYLIARQVDSMVTTADGKPSLPTTSFETSLLLPAGKGAVLSGRVLRSPDDLDSLLAVTETPAFNLDALKNLGTQILDKLVFPDIAAALKVQAASSAAERPQVVVLHDSAASKLPWETLVIDGWEPALEGGLVRRFLAENMSVAKWLDQRTQRPDLSILLVVDPTSDLPGALAEGEFLRNFFATLPGIHVTERFQSQASRKQLLEDFKSGEYDVVHYAGHGGFTPEHPGRSGLYCAGYELLTGTDLSALGQLPMLVFFNACQVGRIRGQKAESRARHLTGKRQLSSTNIGVAEALLRGGVSNFLGTYWSVGDAAAETFSTTFYPLVLQGGELGDAILKARLAVQKKASVDWADYMFYSTLGLN